ncbi:MAG TPA: ABC transporter permease [Actinomycetota bacterium]|jgi:lipooligosaccharide transport system permease protein|nr:ABC transporter permease [Actinomycetota bacterium]
MKRPGALPSRLSLRLAYRAPDVRWASAARLWQRNVANYAHTWMMNILPNFFEPFFYLLAIGFGLGRFVESVGGVEYARFIAPGLAAVSAMYGCVFDATFNVFVKLHFDRLYDAVTAAPLTPEDVVAGELLWSLTRGLLYGVPFVLIAAGFGLVHSPWVVLTPVAIVLIGWAFGTIALTYTSLIPSIDLYSFFFTLFVTPMFLFSGIFFPIETLPGWAQPLAWFSPLYHAAAMMRELFGAVGPTDPLAAAGHGLWLAALGALLYPVAPNVFRHRLIA